MVSAMLTFRKEKSDEHLMALLYLVTTELHLMTSGAVISPPNLIYFTL